MTNSTPTQLYTNVRPEGRPISNRNCGTAEIILSVKILNLKNLFLPKNIWQYLRKLGSICQSSNDISDWIKANKFDKLAVILNILGCLTC